MDKVNNVNISWEAEEYIQRKHSAWWYIILILIAGGLVTLSIFLQQWTFIAVVVLGAIALIILAVRPPRVLHYTMNDKGIKENEKMHLYADYKSFGIMKDGQHFSIVLVPRKRFGTRLRVLFPEQKGEEIVDVFGSRLPMEEVKTDFIDKIVKILQI